MTCIKQTVTAKIIAIDGSEFIGTNWCQNPQDKCPRDTQGYETGQGYHLCNEICGQSSHAEVDAINKAGEKAKGAKLYLSGHTYACEPCKSSCLSAGIDEIIILG